MKIKNVNEGIVFTCNNQSAASTSISYTHTNECQDSFTAIKKFASLKKMNTFS